jgi:hypothetical protein
MKTDRKSSPRRVILYCLILTAAQFLMLPASFAGEKPDSVKQLEPVVTSRATLRGLTKPFEAVIDGEKVYFQNGFQFVGEVVWLDEATLELKAANSPLQVRIPLDAVIKLEMKLEKKNWPIASGTLLGAVLGVGLPSDDNLSNNRQALQRMSRTTSGIVLGFSTGLFIKHMLASKWQEVPLEQARRGIKRSEDY